MFYGKNAAKYLKVALIQMCVTPNKTKNLKAAAQHIKTATSKGSDLIILPECFNSPYGVKYFKKYSECLEDGPTVSMLSKAAKSNCIYLVGGTFPERYDDHVYNCCTVWNPDGEMIATFRKIHLFDIDVPGKIRFIESEVLSRGNLMATFKMRGLKAGLGICYDIRFEELAKLYRLRGCHMLIYPAAFNLTTGPLHFELLQRARAVDNQCFVCVASPARCPGEYKAWGYSQVTNPWGRVIAQADETEQILYAKLNLKLIKEARTSIPIFVQRRKDLYKLKWIGDD